MRKKYNIRIPKGKEVKNVKTNIVNGNIKVSFDLDDVFEPKDGDFLHNESCDITVIYKETHHENCSVVSYAGAGSHNITFHTGIGWGLTSDYRPATEQEKQSFLERLEKECGKRWNPETKQIEDIRWRAEENELYYYLIVGNPTIVKNMADMHLLFDDVRYESGNYFRTYEAAKKVADQIKEIFKNSKAE